MKKLNKILALFFIFILTLSTISLGATSNSKDLKLEIVENNICKINIKESAIFEKKISKYDLEKKELTMQLQISNIAKAPLADPTEIFLVIDTSDSMKREVSTGVTRMQAITDAASKLSTELLKNKNVKIGIVTFSTSDNFGTIADAKLKTTLTSSSSDISSIISAITYDGNGQTNIDAGITLASQNFSSTCENKYILLLTDGVPNYSIGKSTFEYSGTTATNTKAKLEKITKTDKINLISVMTGVESNVENPETGKTYKELAEEIFGTFEKPNYGKFYYIPDSEIEKTISEDILKDITTKNNGILTDIKIYDYFPQEIVDNFDFEYVSSPNLGTVSASIDLQNNCIVWSIDELSYGQVATLSYKLTVKENVNSDIINVILKTNEKVDIITKEIPEPVTSDVSPKIKLTGDTTKAPDKIPQTGLSNTIYVVLGISIIALVYTVIKLYTLKRNVK